MPDNDLVLKMIMDLETKEALKKADNFIDIVRSKVGLSFKQTDIFKNVFEQKAYRSTATHDFFRGIAKDGEAVIEVIAQINKKTKKLDKYTANTLTEKGIAEYFDLDISQYQPKSPSGRKKQEKKESKFLNRFKSYGLLRIVRSIFMAIEKGLSQGIEKLTAFDKQANKTIASLSSSADKAFGGIALSIMPLIEAVTPILNTLSNVIANIGNSISRASAESKGLTEYSKINLDYMKQTANEANKLLTSFDKFESLNAKESPFITGNVEEDKDSDALGQTVSVLTQIGNLLLAFGTYKIITWIRDGGLTKLKDSLGGIKGKIDDISSAGLIASASFAFISSIVNLITVIKNWNSQSLVTKITAITSAVLGLASVIFAILSAIPAIGHAHVFKAVSMGLMAGAVLTGAVSAMRFENGGVPDRGSLFIAGESGAELIHTMPSGQTGVTNIVQFKQAMVEALYEASDVFQNENGGVVLNLDGAEIARSKRFKSELNRTNSGLNLR